jgi:hypothetical protein
MMTKVAWVKRMTAVINSFPFKASIVNAPLARLGQIFR